MLCADAVRALGLAALAFLSVRGALHLWELMAVAVGYGAATAFFDPASDALVPSMPVRHPGPGQLARSAHPPAGLAVGGVVIGAIGVGWSFGLDAASFVVSADAAGDVADAPAGQHGNGVRSMRREVAAGLRVTGHAWLWATLASAAIAYLLFMGPTEVLLSVRGQEPTG